MQISSTLTLSCLESVQHGPQLSTEVRELGLTLTYGWLCKPSTSHLSIHSSHRCASCQSTAVHRTQAVKKTAASKFYD